MKRLFFGLAALALTALLGVSCVKTVPVSSLVLSQSSLTLVEGAESNLAVTVVPDNATDKSVVWSSSDQNVASVTGGLVKAIAPGSTTIKAATPDGQVSVTCAVTVTAKVISVTSVSLDKTSLEMLVGDEITLNATVSPDDATDKGVSWSSDKPAVASVKDGKVSAVAAGTATITVKTNDGAKTATCAVTVTVPVVHVTSVSLDQTALEMTVGDEATLKATVSPDDATDKSVTWSSDNTDVATVTDGKVSAVAAGSATITVKTNDGEKTATCMVTVSSPQIAATKMTFERLPDMLEARASFPAFYCGNELVVAGGHLTGFAVTTHAEYFANGAWTQMEMTSTHDNSTYTMLPSGKVMILGGTPVGSGISQSSAVDIYDPGTHSFSAGPSMNASRALFRAMTMSNGDVIVSGNWYNDDSIERYSAESGTFEYVKDVSQERSFPYILQSASDNAVIFSSQYGDILVDRLSGDAFTPELFLSWKPLGLDSSFLAGNCFIGDASEGDYSYLIGLTREEADLEYGLGLVHNGEFSKIGTDFEIPAYYNDSRIYYNGPILVDASKKVAYMFGSDRQSDNTTCFIVKIDYSKVQDGGKAGISFYYSDPIEGFPGNGGQSGFVLMPDGRILVIGGIYDSNFSPFAVAYAFKPF